jgi:hypothetical protein
MIMNTWTNRLFRCDLKIGSFNPHGNGDFIGFKCVTVCISVFICFRIRVCICVHCLNGKSVEVVLFYSVLLC